MFVICKLFQKKFKKLKQKSANGFATPFEENDDDVARIAKELEKKYGASYGSGRGRSKKDDHCDIGLGYDESDSFIDNTEAVSFNYNIVKIIFTKVTCGP